MIERALYNITAAFALLSVGCGDQVTVPGSGGASSAPSGSGGAGGSGPAVGGADAGSNGVTSASAAGGGGEAGGTGSCVPIVCFLELRQCGDCIDNDGDGLIDMDDPDCLGPCDNNEEDLYFFPGGNISDCWPRDCHYDMDPLSANDECRWSHHCDPLSPGGCEYKPDHIVNTPKGPLTCDELSQEQSQQCHDFCGPLTPNGCDCFGCCELPAESGKSVYVGHPGCGYDRVDDPEYCPPCTPVPACLNPCETCELCLGKTVLPPGCGGVQSCAPGRAPCGLEGQAKCPEGEYCLTGCCTPAVF